MFQSPDSGGLIPQTATRRLLVVDDEPTLRLGFAYALSNKNTRVDTASNGRQALEILSVAAYDIIILDLRMPDIDGIGVIKNLREIGILTPVVLCSAALNPAAAASALLSGVVDFLLKPIRPADLRDVVEFVLHPSNEPFSLAMKAARTGDFSAALRLISQPSASHPHIEAWKEILTLLRDKTGPEGNPALENKVRESLSRIAFVSPESP